MFGGKTPGLPLMATLAMVPSRPPPGTNADVDAGYKYPSM
jgi:hypothetical protein